MMKDIFIGTVNSLSLAPVESRERGRLRTEDTGADGETERAQGIASTSVELVLPMQFTKLVYILII